MSRTITIDAVLEAIHHEIKAQEAERQRAFQLDKCEAEMRHTYATLVLKDVAHMIEDITNREG